jgi:hypothetical protein
VVVLKPLENLLCPSLVFSLPGQVDEQLIHVNDEPAFSDEVAKEVVHERLKHGGRVAETEKHDCRLKETEGSDERRLPVVLGSNQHIIVTPAYVHFGKDVRASEAVNKVGDEGEGVCVLDGVRVDISVVLAGRTKPSFLWTKKNGDAWGDLGG